VLWLLVLPDYVTAGVALLIRWLADEEGAGPDGRPGPLAEASQARLAGPAWP